jgi:hypothetical protein
MKKFSLAVAAVVALSLVAPVSADPVQVKVRGGAAAASGPVQSTSLIAEQHAYAKVVAANLLAKYGKPDLSHADAAIRFVQAISNNPNIQKLVGINGLFINTVMATDGVLAPKYNATPNDGVGGVSRKHGQLVYGPSV